MNKQLLCTFSNSSHYNDTIKDLCNQYELIDKKIFVFVSENNPNELYFTFNVLKNQVGNRHKNTISIHRKKQTNTLYTLNAMNRLIEDENNGVFDKNFQLNWDFYKDSIILTNEVGVKITKIKLFCITPI